MVPALQTACAMTRVALSVAVALFACTGDAPDSDVANDENPTFEPNLVAAGQHATVCHANGLNQRSGPGTSFAVLRVIPGGSDVVVVATSSDSKWIQNTWNSNVGWSSSAYLCPVAGGTAWPPTPGTTWQWQLTGAIDETVHAQMIDIDLFDNSAALIARLKASGKRVVCYFSAGSYENWRPDASQFPSAVLGNPMDGWPGERWLNVKRMDLLMPIMTARMDLAVQKGCDGLEPDNVDVWTNDAEAGLSVTAQDQLAYNRAIASAAHARGLAVALKNDNDQASTLVDDFDFSINEQCMEYDECDSLMPFIQANKAVFNCEYNTSLSAMCAQAATRHFSSIKKSMDLDAPLQTCQ
jgi:hypothetical protein